MFFERETAEQKSDRVERKLQQLESQIEALDRDAAALFAELGVTPEQVHRLLKDENQFTPEDWKQLQEMRQQRDTRLSCDLSNVANPLATKKAYSGRKVESHWLLVR